jgi:hypothetical protein
MAAPFICTPENPWKREYGTPVRHSNVREVGEQENGYPGGDIVTVECTNCGHRWRAELPQ